ncbi:MAG: teichuronic acid biosynthesis glycosyltransferase TuaG [Thalassolituus oleivorans]|jgi:teichuronic acid biosynthesis glycosyltransferase TuaG
MSLLLSTMDRLTILYYGLKSGGLSFPAQKVTKSAQNSGPGDARNKGIGLARANLIALIDSDDVWFEHKLEMQVAVHAATDCVFSCTAFKFGDTEIYQSKTDYISLLKNNVINTS